MEELIYDQDKESSPNLLFSKNPYSFLTRVTITKQKRSDIENISMKKQQPILKKLIKKHKINGLVRNYCNKIKRNNQFSPPVEFHLEIDTNKSYFYSWIETTQGYEMTTLQTTLFTITNLSILLVLTVFYSLAVVFPEVEQIQVLRGTQIIGLFFYLIEMLSNFVAKKYVRGKEIINLKEIWLNYIRSKFTVDLMSLIALSLDLSFKNSNVWIKLFRIAIIFKMSQSLEKLQTLQNIYITTTHRQQYWGLCMVFIINFSFAHILSILLNAMAFLDSTDNWLIVKGIGTAVWWQKYIWGYYWGTTTMLTVGFGDIVAANYKEAICLVFIEMISCITLAYNINCVGNLINNLRRQSNEKNKSLKIFHQMAIKNKVDPQLENKINSYIQESYQIKKSFNFVQEDLLIDNLPNTLKLEYLNEINLKIFKEISFLKNLTMKTQSLIARSITRIIAHPQQIIQKERQSAKMILLNQGILGFSIGNQGSTTNKGTVVDSLSVLENQNPKLVSLGFVRSQLLEHDIKSLTYSIIHFLQKQNLVEILKTSNFDYEHYCMMRDKSCHLVNQMQLYKCAFCPTQYHSKFICPKLHYIPFSQHVVNKYLEKIKKGIQPRRSNISKSRLSKKSRPLKMLDIIKDDIRSIRSIQNEQQLTSYDIVSQNDHTANESHETNKRISLKKNDNLLDQHLNHQNPAELIKLIYSLNNSHPVDFWSLEMDLLHDWKYYFPQYNSTQLSSKKLKRR